jgi:3-oxoisoapionate decarboxylase
VKLGIGTYTYMWSIGFEGARPAEPLTALGLLERTRELGVRVVQVGPNLPLDKLPEAELAQFVEQARAWGLELELCTRGLDTQHLIRQVALCKRVGARLLRTIAELGGQPMDYRDMPQYLRAIEPMLEREGVSLGLENGKIPAADMKWAVAGLRNPRVGIVLDMANSLAVPEGWRQVTETLAPYTMCLHLKDFIVKRFWHMMGFVCEGRPTGQGQLDIPWLLEMLKVSPYDYNAIIELWPPEQKTLEETIALEQDWALQSVPYARQFFPE